MSVAHKFDPARATIHPRDAEIKLALKTIASGRNRRKILGAKKILNEILGENIEYLYERSENSDETKVYLFVPDPVAQ
jgi:hypothetical protein